MAEAALLVTSLGDNKLDSEDGVEMDSEVVEAGPGVEVDDGTSWANEAS
jgi:hypothetical protein